MMQDCFKIPENRGGDMIGQLLGGIDEMIEWVKKSIIFSCKGKFVLP